MHPTAVPWSKQTPEQRREYNKLAGRAHRERTEGKPKVMQVSEPHAITSAMKLWK